MRESYYKPSGQITFKFLIYFALLALVSIPILSTAYIYAAHYIPFIYLNILIAAGCGVLLGVIIRKAIKMGKARNPLLVMLLTLAATVAMKYVQWCIYIPLALDNIFGAYDAYGGITIAGRFIESWFFFITPRDVFQLAASINEVGAWSINTSSAQAPQAVSGVMLLIVWIFEFIIMAATAVVVTMQQVRFPFSEESDNWYEDSKKGFEMDKPEEFEAIKASMENGNYTDLVQLAKAGKTNDRLFLKVSLFQPPQPSDAEWSQRFNTSEPGYMSIDQVTVAKKGKVNSKNLFRYLAIDAQSMRALVESSVAARDSEMPSDTVQD